MASYRYCIASCLIYAILSSVSFCEELYPDAAIILKEGFPGGIQCMSRGSGKGDYIWKRGDNQETSTPIAYFVEDTTSKDDLHYAVTENGTLLIYNVTLEDEGKYFCHRMSTDQNICYGEVVLKVQASLEEFVLSIDVCEQENTCVLLMEPSQTTQLTCNASEVPHSMMLKWFNGSKETTEAVEYEFGQLRNGSYEYISSKITIKYGTMNSLTCQAIYLNGLNAVGIFAHVHLLEIISTEDNSLTAWILFAIALITTGFIIMLLFTLLIKARTGTKPDKTDSTEKDENKPLTMDSINDKQEIDRLNTLLKAAKMDSINDKQEIDRLNTLLKAAKIDSANDTREINELKSKLEDVKEKLERKIGAFYQQNRQSKNPQRNIQEE